MAAKSKLLIQPKFDKRLQATTTALGTQVGLQRGYMIWADKKMSQSFGYTGGPLGDGRDVLNFQFNPSTISSDYSVGNASLQAAMMYQVPGDSGNLLAPLQQTVSWQLYFDRTYELNYSSGTNQANDPAIIGAQADVLAIMQFTGVLANGLSSSNVAALTNDQGGQGATGASVSSSQIDTLLANGGMMMMVPCYVYFGNAWNQINQNGYSNASPTSWNFSAVNQQLGYYGYISEWSVQYTHWTESMVPIRCAITVNFTMLPQPDQSTQKAVWQDTQKLRGLPFSPVPYANGATAPPPNPWVAG